MAHEHEETPAGRYYLVFAAIAVLVLVAAGVSFMGEMPQAPEHGRTVTDVDAKGPTRLVINLVIASVQVALLGLFFMHLKGADRLTWLVVGAGGFWLLILFLLLLTDYL